LRRVTCNRAVSKSTWESQLHELQSSRAMTEGDQDHGRVTVAVAVPPGGSHKAVDLSLRQIGERGGHAACRKFRTPAANAAPRVNLSGININEERHCGKCGTTAGIPQKARRNHPVHLTTPGRRRVMTTAIVSPSVQDTRRYYGRRDILPSARNLRLALGARFSCKTRLTGNTIVEHRRLSFAMEIPSAERAACGFYFMGVTRVEP
jgi:hypothetical protein